MKKFLLLTLLLFAGLIITGCAQKNQLSQSEIFDKKQECLELEKEAKERRNSVDYIFYSPIKNSCLVLTSTPNGDVVEIHDFMSKKFIIGRFSFCEKRPDIDKCLKDRDKFDKELEKLKGE